jgi:hypothetical protein
LGDTEDVENVEDTVDIDMEDTVEIVSEKDLEDIL